MILPSITTPAVMLHVLQWIGIKKYDLLIGLVFPESIPEPNWNSRRAGLINYLCVATLQNHCLLQAKNEKENKPLIVIQGLVKATQGVLRL